MEDTVHMATSHTTTTSTNTNSTGMDTTAPTQQHTTLTRTSHTEENEEVSTPLVFLLAAQALTLALAQALQTLVLPIPDLPALPQCPLRKLLISEHSFYIICSSSSGTTGTWPSGQPAYYGPAPTHPDCVTIKEKLCTLVCPDGEVPALGHDTSVCHEYANGSQKWVKRLTHCVKSADIMALLVEPPARK